MKVKQLAQCSTNLLVEFIILLTDAQKLGADFVFGYLQAMDGEKDPRNLIVAFACAQMVIHNFPLGVFVEDMFEVVSCYFPVDFAPVSIYLLNCIHL